MTPWHQLTREEKALNEERFAEARFYCNALSDDGFPCGCVAERRTDNGEWVCGFHAAEEATSI